MNNSKTKQKSPLEPESLQETLNTNKYLPKKRSSYTQKQLSGNIRSGLSNQLTTKDSIRIQSEDVINFDNNNNGEFNSILSQKQPSQILERASIHEQSTLQNDTSYNSFSQHVANNKKQDVQNFNQQDMNWKNYMSHPYWEFKQYSTQYSNIQYQNQNHQQYSDSSIKLQQEFKKQNSHKQILSNNETFIQQINEKLLENVKQMLIYYNDQQLHLLVTAGQISDLCIEGNLSVKTRFYLLIFYIRGLFKLRDAILFKLNPFDTILPAQEWINFCNHEVSKKILNNIELDIVHKNKILKKLLNNPKQQQQSKENTMSTDDAQESHLDQVILKYIIEEDLKPQDQDEIYIYLKKLLKNAKKQGQQMVQAQQSNICMRLGLNIALIIVYQLKQDSEFDTNLIFQNQSSVPKYPYLLDFKYFYTWQKLQGRDEIKELIKQIFSTSKILLKFQHIAEIKEELQQKHKKLHQQQQQQQQKQQRKKNSIQSPSYQRLSTDGESEPSQMQKNESWYSNEKQNQKHHKKMLSILMNQMSQDSISPNNKSSPGKNHKYSFTKSSLCNSNNNNNINNSYYKKVLKKASDQIFSKEEI